MIPVGILIQVENENEMGAVTELLKFLGAKRAEATRGSNTVPAADQGPYGVPAAAPAAPAPVVPEEPEEPREISDIELMNFVREKIPAKGIATIAGILAEPEYNTKRVIEVPQEKRRSFMARLA